MKQKIKVLLFFLFLAYIAGGIIYGVFLNPKEPVDLGVIEDQNVR